MKALKDTVAAVKIAKRMLQALNKNLASTHDEYMRGAIARGAFEYTLQRYDNAFFAINSINHKTELFNEELRKDTSPEWIDKLDENIGYCLSWMCHDLRAYADIDLKNDKRKRERCLANIKKIEDHLSNIGFTETNPFFHIKTKPK